MSNAVNGELVWEREQTLPTRLSSAWKGNRFIRAFISGTSLVRIVLTDEGTCYLDCGKPEDFGTNAVYTTWPIDELPWNSDELRAWAEVVWRMS